MSKNKIINLNTVKVPSDFVSIFKKAQKYVHKYFKKISCTPPQGTIEVYGERYLLIRAASFSKEFFDLILSLYKDRGEKEAFYLAQGILFDIAHALGKADAKSFANKIAVKDNLEIFSTGPILFAHAGWGLVEILPESNVVPNENYYLSYNHHHSFEVDEWLKRGIKTSFPVCTMNAGYSSGWCEECFGISLVTVEVECRAKGDNICKFIMAPPHRIADYLKIDDINRDEIPIPEFFKRKRLEDKLKRGEETAKALLNASTDYAFLLDVEGEILALNNTAANFLEKTLPEIIGKKGFEVFETFIPVNKKRFFEVVKSGKMFKYEDEKKGKRIETTLHPIFDEHGNVVKVAVFSKDITAKKIEEMELKMHRDHLQDLVLERTYKLEVINKRLEEEIKVRKEAETLLTKEKELFFSILQKAPYGVILLDKNFEILYLNPEFNRITGYTIDDIKTLNDLLKKVFPRPELREKLVHKKEEHKTQEDLKKEISIVSCKDKSIKNVEITFSKLDEKRSILTISDITERKKIEDDLRQRTAQLESLRIVGLELAAQLDLEKLLYSIVKHAANMLNAVGGALYLYNKDKELLELKVVVGPNYIPRGIILKKGEGVAGRVIETGEVVIVDDYQQWKGRSKKFEKYSIIKSVIGTPITWGKEHIGVLNVVSDATCKFTQKDANLIDLFAVQAAIAIRNVRLYEEASSRAERLGVVNRIAKAIGSILDLDTLLKSISQEITSIFKPDGFFISLYDEETKEFECKIRTDKKPTQEDEFCRALSSAVMTQRSPVLIRDISDDIAMLPILNVNLERHSIPFSMIGVPMEIGNHLIGVIGMYSYKANAFDHEESILLSTIGEQMAIAIQNARLYLALNMELNERKNTEEALRDSERRYKELYKKTRQREELYVSLLNSTPDAVVIYDLEGKVRYINPAFTKIFGFTLEDIKGKRVPYVPETEEERSLEQIKKIINGEYVSGFETKRLTKDGKTLDIILSSSRYYDHEGNPAGIVVILRDITKSKQIEKQLFHAQKMEAVGTLAGGIAHDFNNILQAVQGYVELLLLDKKEDDPGYKELMEVKRFIKRGGVLTKQLLTFSRKVESKRQLLVINDVVNSIKELVYRTIPKMISIEIDLDENLKFINADPMQIEQILMNLIVNAKDAMPHGGKLTIRTRNVFLDEDYCSMYPNINPGHYVLLSVTDTGIGIDKEALSRIYDPFYTTKPPGKGTGLGLAIVYGLVEDHGGHIICESILGKGTSFKIYFPPISQIDGLAEREKERPLPQRGSGTILLVDDEEVLSRYGKEMLSRFGYEVITASNGKEALEIYNREKEKINLVILDLVMPDMGGKECLKRLININPDLKVIVATGYALEDTEKVELETIAKGLIQKPYEIEDMLNLIKKVLK